MILHGRKVTVIDPDAGGPITPELAAAGRALHPVSHSSVRAQPVRPPLGLGDLVERWAKPVAVRIDRATARLPARYRTSLAWCGACSARQAKLNAWVRDVRSAVDWWGALPRIWRAAKTRLTQP